MMATIAPTSFSENGEYLVHSSADGVIKIWETETGLLRQEYTPSSHLSAACTCLAWCPRRTTEESPRKKKKRRSRTQSESGTGADLIALGTTSGAVLLYSYLNGDLLTQLESSHSDRINDVCWSSDGEEVFACSNDHHVTEWDVKSSKVKHKWKADKGIVHSVCYCHQYLLSAGRSIKLWDLSTRTVVQTFTGHATEVFRLLPVPKLLRADGDSAAVDSSYFMSAALNDRLINVWHINQSSKSKSAVASFTLPDEPCMLDLSRTSNGDQPIMLSVVTRGGQLLIFEHVLNGTLKKPLKAKFTIQCASAGVAELTPRPIAILAAALVKGPEPCVLVSHGSFLKPTFEKVVCNGQSDICLVREDPTPSSVQTEKAVSKVKTPEVSRDVTDLIPAVLAPALPTQEAAPAKKKKRKPSTSELTMEDRLNAISIEVPSERAGSAPPKADALALLLTQGLQSQNKLIVNNVLQNTNDTIIRNTVKRLPVPMIIPLVKELSQRIQGHAQSGHMVVKWIKMLLTVHTSYLMTFPELVEKFSGMYQMMTSRVSMFSRLSRLQGKLDLVMSQITAQDQEEGDTTTTTQQALLVYQDDSSENEEEIVLDDLMASHSESEDNWEELSDMEVQDGEGENGEDMSEEGENGEDMSEEGEED